MGCATNTCPCCSVGDVQDTPNATDSEYPPPMPMLRAPKLIPVEPLIVTVSVTVFDRLHVPPGFLQDISTFGMTVFFWMETTSNPEELRGAELLNADVSWVFVIGLAFIECSRISFV